MFICNNKSNHNYTDISLKRPTSVSVHIYKQTSALLTIVIITPPFPSQYKH